MRTAVVIGASMGGLLAAQALAEEFEVVVVERDRLPEEPEHRKGVPQSHHLHGLHTSGREAMEQLLPGLVRELEDAGAVVLNALRDVEWVVGGHRFASADGALTGHFASRPLLEHLVRTRVLANPRVTVLQETVALGMRLSGARVTGVRVSGPDDTEQVLDVDLLVDASGRSSIGVRWLTAAGWPAPREEVVDIDLVYVSMFLRAPHAQTTFVAAQPDTLRSCGLAPVEGDRWVLTASGICGTKPPTDLPGLRAFLAAGPRSRVADCLEGAEPLSPVSVARYPSSRRRLFDAKRGLPAGFLPLGDALAGFNPAYAQGMSVAAVEAVRLREALGRRDLVATYLRGADKAVDRAWQTSVFADLAIPQVVGRRTAQTRMAGALTARACAAASVDPQVGEAFLRVAGMVEPPEALLRPRTLARIVRGSRRAARAGQAPAAAVPAQAQPVDESSRQPS